MAVGFNDVRAVLLQEEPDYASIRGLGTDALPHLNALLRGNDTGLAAKAAYAAAQIGTDDGAALVREAAAHADPIVRVAAAAAAAHLDTEAASEIVMQLSSDPDPGVARVALKSMPTSPSAELQHWLVHLRDHGPDPDLRQLADRTIERLTRS